MRLDALQTIQGETDSGGKQADGRDGSLREEVQDSWGNKKGVQGE